MTYTSFRAFASPFFIISAATGLLVMSACGGGSGGGGDAGRDTGGSRVDAFVPGDMDAFCMVECAEPPLGCRWEPIVGECSCGTLVCEDAGMLGADDAYVPPGTDAATRADAFVPPGTDAGGSLCTTNAECGATEWCASATCGGLGACVERPTACPRIFDPVCGCDGMTYGNDCVANGAGVNVASRGECAGGCATNAECSRAEYCASASCDGSGACEARPTVCPDLFAPVCGCDGMTYGNACDAAAAGVRVARTGECSSTGGCTSNAECGRREYCAGTGCDTPGTCAMRSEICPGIFAPVCGCDGMTYSNSCEAASAGVRVASDGECAPPSDTCSPPCTPDQTCQLCRGPGGGVWACLPRGAVC